MSRIRRFRSDVFAILALFVLALLWFSPVLLPPLLGRTLLPFDNLYSFEPWRSLQPNLIAHNGLLSDLVLENAVWKLHIRRALADGQFPLWNPHIFTGLPFLAAGQASTFYPLSLLFYLLPLDIAYGWFTALQIGLAGANTYLFGRVLGLRLAAALFSAIVFMFSGFLVVSVVFTMFIAAVVWLPLLLAVIEWIVRKQEQKGAAPYSPIPYIVLGSLIIGVMILAGHPELIYYTLLVAGAYSLMRLLAAWRMIGKSKNDDRRSDDLLTNRESRVAPSLLFGLRSSAPAILQLAIWLLAMVALGVALGGVQLIPLLELVPMNFREGSASLAQVREWAWPSRHVLTFPLPNIFGNPSHHTWFDIWTRRWTPATVNALGEPIDTIFWGIKNYVEGGNYLGIVTWVLAAVAVVDQVVRGARGVAQVWRRRSVHDATVNNSQFTIHNSQLGYSTLHAPRSSHTWFFIFLAALSLLFAFGTPLYAILFYGLPGWNQLHSPFRWVFPFTLSMAVLGGIGLNVLLCTIENRRSKIGFQASAASDGAAEARESFLDLRSLLFALCALAGIGAIVLVVASFAKPEPFIAFGQRAVDGSDLAQMAFADGRMFWSYQSANLLQFGLVALLGGSLLLWLSRRNPASPSPDRPTALLLLFALLLLDLWFAHGRFNPAADVALSPLAEEGVPPVVRFVNEREGEGDLECQLSIVNCQSAIEEPWRFTTFNMPGEKTFNANVGMYYGWQDVRGYDSIIPRQYVQFLERVAPQENELLYNRVAPLYSDVTGDPYGLLDNPLLDLLNVKYLLTEHYVPNPSWHEVYRDEAIGVYENQEALPRTFFVPEARVVPKDEQPLTETDLRDVVFIEEVPADENALVRASPALADARISRYTANDVFVDVNLSDRGWLVLSDAYFPGWKAFIRPFGGEESQERELTIYRADSALRTVYLPDAGQWTIRFVYSPMSFKLGIYVSFIAAMTLALLMLYWMWGKFYRPERSEGDVRTVAKNSLVPMTLNLANKAIDFAFAMLYVRILGPDGTGKYYFVVAIYGFFEIVSRYGLGTLLTRDVAADKNQSSRYLTNVLALRTLLWALTMPVMALVTWFYANIGTRGLLDVESIGKQEVQAIAILGVAMLFANWADALSSSFHAFEKMEYPAGLSSASAILKVTLGATVLLLGWSFVGLAAVALVVSIIQVIWLYLLLRITLFKPQWHWDWPLQWWMLRNSGSLMINHLLATIFWRIDVWILRPLSGAAAVGLYSVGLKYLDGLNIIPSVFTMAVFPLMSRYATRGDDNLLRSYRVSVRLLTMVSLPIAMSVTFLAEPLVWLVGGAQFLNVPETVSLFGREITFMGGSDLALQVIIWSIPIGFINSVTQFVLIAINQQHFLTRAFVLGVAFNTLGNFLLIPHFGYLGAAFITILSEFSLLFPFYYCVRRNVGSVSWPKLIMPPAFATILMGVFLVLSSRYGLNIWLAVGLSWGAYVFGLFIVGAFRNEDLAMVGEHLPLGPLRRFVGSET